MTKHVFLLALALAGVSLVSRWPLPAGESPAAGADPVPPVVVLAPDAPDRFCILFLDIGGVENADDLAEGKLLARALRYKLEFDYLYRNQPPMSRAYPAVELDHALGADVHTQDLSRRARGVTLVTEMLTGAESFARLLETHRPNVVHVLAHGAGRGAFDEGGWGDHADRMWGFVEIRKALEDVELDLGQVCLVTPGCDLGRDPILAGFRALGFGAVIAWPGSVCVHEALEFDEDLYEALVSQFVLHRGPEAFWSFADGCPPPLRKAFEFARDGLRQRYRLLDEHFADVVGQKDVAGYYLHTPSWFDAHYRYAALPVLEGSADR